MTFSNILCEKKHAIAYVTVNQPKVLNALNMATMEELRAAFHDIKNDAGLRVAFLTGAGEKAFIAGADIGELAKHDAVSGKEYTHRGQSVLDLIENLGKPVIACINGFAAPRKIRKKGRRRSWKNCKRSSRESDFFAADHADLRMKDISPQRHPAASTRASSDTE